MSAFNYSCEDGHRPILYCTEPCPICGEKPKNSPLVRVLITAGVQAMPLGGLEYGTPDYRSGIKYGFDRAIGAVREYEKALVERIKSLDYVPNQEGLEYRHGFELGKILAVAQVQGPERGAK